MNEPIILSSLYRHLWEKNKEPFTQGWKGGTPKQLTSYENTFIIYNLSRHVPRLQLVLEKII